MLTKQEIESKLPMSFYKLHLLITRILKENDIIQSNEESKDGQLETVVKIVMKLQTALMSQKLRNVQDTQWVIEQMKPEMISSP